VDLSFYGIVLCRKCWDYSEANKKTELSTIIFEHKSSEKRKKT
jgi:hypothetical protein